MDLGSQEGDRLKVIAADSPEPGRVAQYFAELQQRHPAFLHKVSENPERLGWLALAFTLSRFLSDEILRHPEWILEINDLGESLSVQAYGERLRTFLQWQGPHDFALFRRRELLRILLRDGLGISRVAAVTEEISNLADSILAAAVDQVRAEVQARYGVPLCQGQAEDARPAEFTVLALGKLGGRELNYSSDIDLMFLYSGNGETTGPHTITNKEFFNKVANGLTTLLSSYTSSGICYRVDLRLRPDGRLGEVCTSLEGAREYYARRARDWELQMLVKARVAAGETAPGEELLTFLRPFIYSTTLDFCTIETMSATRERLGEKLARKRLKQDQLDVKLAPGGIRDIEFLAQCLQRLHGARDSSVRQTGTLFALSSLREGDLLSTTEHAQLAEAYKFLRNLEHRLQFDEDKQTHTLPTNLRELEPIALRLPPPEGPSQSRITSGAQLLRVLNQHLENVQVIYERIVHAQRPLLYGTGSSLDAYASQEQREQGRPSVLSATAPGTTFGHVEQAIPVLAQFFGARGLHRSLDDFARFTQALAASPVTAEMLKANPAAAAYTARIFELSPYLSEEIIRTPELMEELYAAAGKPSARLAFEGLAAPLNDIEGLRRFYTRELFRILVASVCAPEPVFQTLDRASGLAEFLIARAYRIALEQALEYGRKQATPTKPFSDPENQLMVVALGRLGMREFDIGSDADLVFVIPDSESVRQRFWIRVAERMIDILSSYRGDAPVLSLDTRLRPNGREGILVQTESAYVDYFANKSEAWEGIAYMKARLVAGDSDRATKFLTELQQVDWRRYGQGGRSRHNLQQMRLRLEREQSAIAPLKAGHGGYYDADFILMYLRLKGAGMFFKSLNTPERIDVVEKMGHLERSDADFLLRATTFFRAVDHGSRIVSGRAEEKLPASEGESEMVAALLARWTGDQPTAGQLSRELARVQASMRRLFNRIFD